MAEKPLLFSEHAKEQMRLRGATEKEVVQAIQLEPWLEAKRGKLHATKQFEFGSVSPMNQKWYAYKSVDAVFVEELQQIVVITVKVYYHE